MAPSDYDNDELVFLDDAGHTEPELALEQAWKVLLVDDDEEIHTVTRLALSDLVLNNKPLEFFHAYSGAEAKKVIDEIGRDLAIILLDVVMESDDAGFQVVKYLREDMNLVEPRIILRTGQPGFAPEEDVIKNYDINDYKTKTELTRGKLMTSVISSLRSYQQILTINQSRRGLQKIIASSANLLEEHSIKGFRAGIVTQISSLIGLEAEGLVMIKDKLRRGSLKLLWFTWKMLASAVLRRNANPLRRFAFVCTITSLLKHTVRGPWRITMDAKTRVVDFS